ncbi:MAG: hypothetical protein QF464_16465, partial [Myxococcota bacterium]|nr:hypothetical protein [Myxococcota bacterium]
MSPRVSIAAAALLCLGACLGPQASDELPETATSYPTSDEVAPAETVAKWGNKILAGQGFEPGTIPLLSGFIDGQWAWFWDFGPGTALTAPVYMLVSDVSDDDKDVLPTFTLAELMAWLPAHGVDHLPLFGVIPGQSGYTPLWQVVLVPTTDAYDGERITSVNAIQTGREDGLLTDPIPLPHVVDCPIVHEDTLLEVWGEPRTPKKAYWGGYTVSYFDLGFLGAETLATNDTVTELFGTTPEVVYTLRREGGELLDERLRGVDMTGDGDLNDTNHVFASVPGDADYTPIVVATEVVVDAETSLVDNARLSDIDVKGLDDLFDLVDGALVPNTDRVVALYPHNELRYLPRWLPPPSEPDPADTTEATDAQTPNDATDAGPIPEAADATAASDTRPPSTPEDS